MGLRFTALVLLAAACVSSGCSSAETATEVLVVVDSDLSVGDLGAPGAELTELHLQVYDAAGERLMQEQFLSLATSEGDNAGRLTLPLSFSVAPPTSDSNATFRLVVTGRGPTLMATALEDVAERQMLVSFRPGEQQRVPTFLARACLRELCRSTDALGDETCDPGVGRCVPIPTFGMDPDASPADAGALDASTGDVDASRGDAGIGVDAAVDSAPSVADACRGLGGASTCEQDVFVQCSATGQIVGEQRCLSAQHCQTALRTGSCPTCLEGEYQCNGQQLQLCDAEGVWTTQRECSSAEPCNALARTCTSAFCTPDSRTCEGDWLQSCNDTQDAFINDVECSPGMCDAIAGACDVCVASSRACETDGRSVRLCSTDGQDSTVQPCPTAMPICIGNGVCVQCDAPTDCPAPASPCVEAWCNDVDGSCGTRARGAGTSCPGGICDGSGACVECISDVDCGGADTCVGGQCQACSRADCGTCCSDGDCLCHGSAPTALTSAPGPYDTTSYELSGVGCVYHPVNGTPPYAAIAVVDGFQGTGGCSSLQTSEWGPLYASHGIVTLIAETGAGDQPAMRASALATAIAGLKSENNRASSPLHNQLAGRYGVSGFSMGGGGATLAAQSDSSLLTSLSVMGWGTVGDGVSVPTLFVCGSSDTLGACSSHSQPSYDAMPTSTPRARVTVDSGHAGQPSTDGGKVGAYGLAFQKVYLEGDERWISMLGEVPFDESDLP